MNPAELKLFKGKVAEFDHVVARLVASPPKLHGKLHKEISAQQQWFKERPWVSHFVPHLKSVNERLRNFMHSSSVCASPVPSQFSSQLGLVL